MRTIKSVTQGEVFSHWEEVEKRSIFQRADIAFPLVAYANLRWFSATTEQEDIKSMFIISSGDWSTEGLCVPNFLLTTAVENYKNTPHQSGKFKDIDEKERLFASDPLILDTKLILVAPEEAGPYTIIEGNKRAVALQNLNKMVGLEVYLGVSPNIKTYVWAMCSTL